MRIGIYSGTFDPIHTGHAILASYIAQSGLVDEVWLLVSPRNPLKKEAAAASDEERLQMAQLAAEGLPGVKVSDFEMHLPLPSYTYRTLRDLRESYPDHQFRLIVGADNWCSFSSWADWKRILSEFGLIVYPRPGFIVEGLPAGSSLLADAPLIGISSSEIRSDLAAGRCVRYLVPDPVLAYIRDHKLYSRKLC